MTNSSPKTPAPSKPRTLPKSPKELAEALKQQQYIAGDELAAALHLSLSLHKPLLLEGEAGVGKTELAVCLAKAIQSPLIRLQCYEGVDAAAALYEWNHAAQMIEIRLAEASGDAQKKHLAKTIFSERFLLQRPILQALQAPSPAVLLIDEIDRADEPFEAFLLETLANFQITIPELGTIKAKHKPIVILTSNRTREIHDALRRRCFYCWINYPNPQTERDVILQRVPHAQKKLAAQVASFVQKLRSMDLFKNPGVAEAVEWTAALAHLGQSQLNADNVQQSLSALVKREDDLLRFPTETLHELAQYAQQHPAE